MCGLTAIFAYAGDVLPLHGGELDHISAQMVPRGPDDNGRWIAPEGRTALAHRRLAIIDPSPAGRQPMRLDDESGNARLVITYNGEIYNFRELRAELEAAGVRLKTNSDTEVILHLYDREGPEFLSRLRGMFALAIWDTEKQGLFLARDPLGIKPLYISDDGKTFRAASQVKALQAGGGLSLSTNPAGHVGFYLFGHVPEPHTLWRQITALPAGSSMWVDVQGARSPRRYFSLEQVWAEGEEATAAKPEDVRDALLDSVHHHLVADVPVGVFLSGGLDSATITGLAAEVGSAPIRTVTLAFDEYEGLPRDEAPLAATTAALYGTHHKCQRISSQDFRDRYDDVLAAMDQPTIDGVNSYFVAAAAAEIGLKVALSGIGGDELFGGYDTFRQVPRLVGAVGWIPGLSMFGRGFRVISAPLIRHMTSPKFAGLFEYAASYGAAYLLRRGLFMPWELPSVLDPDLAREGWQALDPIVRLNTIATPFSSPRGRVASLETSWYLRNQLLRDADWAGMAHSVEIRTPLVDVELFAAVAGRNAGKRSMAGAPAQPLPDAVLKRPKTGFFVPVHDWTRSTKNEFADARGLRGWAHQVYRDAPLNLPNHTARRG